MAAESNTPPPPASEDQVVLEHDPLINEAWATFAIALPYVELKLPQGTTLTEMRVGDDTECHTATIRQPPCQMEIRVLTGDALNEDDGNQAPPGQLKMHPSYDFREQAVAGPGLVTSRVKSSSGSFWLYFHFSFEEGATCSDLGRAFEVGMFAYMVVQSVVFKPQSPAAYHFLGVWRIGSLDDWENAKIFCAFDRDGAYMKYGLNTVDTPKSGRNGGPRGIIFEAGHYAVVQSPNDEILVHFLAEGGGETRYMLTDMDGYYRDHSGIGWKKEGGLGEW